MADQLPIVEMWGKRWYLDRRLHQLRNVDNPHNFQDISPELEEPILDLFEVHSSGKMLYEVDRVGFAVTNDLKGWWTVGKTRALAKELNAALASGRIHLHLHSGADDFCTAEDKVKIFVDAVEKPSEPQEEEEELASGVK